MDEDLRPHARQDNEIVPGEVLTEILAIQQNQGVTFQEAVSHVREGLVPPGYQAHPFRKDVPESFLDKLRSMVGTFMYRHQVEEWERKGVPFKTHLYVPEYDDHCRGVHHDRGDHNHILKRIATSTREGKNQDLDLDRFDEAVQTKGTGWHGIDL